jgi:hypothetical protein
MARRPIAMVRPDGDTAKAARDLSAAVGKALSKEKPADTDKDDQD